jgi:flagellar protein FliT
MTCEEVLSLYETVAGITGQMLDAAREGDWEQLAALESLCASHVAALKQEEPPAPLSNVIREQKVRIIKKILADDREIRTITEPWMDHLAALINSTGVERKLSNAYGANQQR